MAVERVERVTKKRNEMLADIAAGSAAILLNFGLDQQRANRAGDEIADFMADSFGGQVVNFPKDFRYKLEKRHQEIMDRFDGTNRNELAQEYGLTVRAIYKICQRARKKKADNAAKNHLTRGVDHV